VLKRIADLMMCAAIIFAMAAIAACGTNNAETSTNTVLPTVTTNATKTENPTQTVAPETVDIPPDDMTEHPLPEFEVEFDDRTNGYAITKYNGTASEVYIPAEIDGIPVTVISGYTAWGVDDEREIPYTYSYTVGAFTGSEVQAVFLPDSIIRIEKSAFSHSSNLKTVELPYGLQEIGNRAFLYCTGLEYINIPDSVTVIDELAFTNCKSLVSVTIPDSVIHIGVKPHKCDK